MKMPPLRNHLAAPALERALPQSVCRGKLLALLEVLLFATIPGMIRASEPPANGPVYVVLWFDTEDYILPASDDAALKLARIALRLAKSLDIAQQKFPLAKIGGTIGRSPFFDHALDRELGAALPQAVMVPRPADPTETAARIALRNFLAISGAPR